MASTAAQQLGRDYYKRKEYIKALEYFDRALSGGRVHSIQLLDQRAACHEKLENYAAALKDAKQAIQLGREDPTGYLRAGKVLKKMGRKNVASEIYAHGLKCVKHIGQGYQALKRAHDEAMTELAPPKSVDPFSVLPRELGIAILELLNFRQRIGIMRVSKQWKNFVRSEPSLWSYLDLSGARKNVRTAFISTAINTGRRKINAAYLHRLYDPAKVLAALYRQCSIERLVVGEVSMDGFHALEPPKTLIELREGHEHRGSVIARAAFIRRLAPQLRVCEISSEVFTCLGPSPAVVQFPEARELNVSLNYQHAFPAEAVCSTEKLETLVLSAFQGRLKFDNFSNLQRLALDGRADYAYQLELPSSLRCLSLYISPTAQRSAINTDFLISEDALSTYQLGLPYLTELVLSAKTSLSRVISALCPVAPVGTAYAPLKRVRLCNADSSTDIFGNAMTTKSMVTDELIARLGAVEYLSLNGIIDLNDQVLTNFVMCFPELKSLEVSESMITGVAIKDMVKLGKIQELTLVNCLKISRDAIDWARARGVRVRYSNPQLTKSVPSKKIRHAW